MTRVSKNILVVDDEPKTLEAVASFLKSRGFSVYTAENGAQALQLFNRINVALVVLDLMMPDMPGHTEKVPGPHRHADGKGAGKRPVGGAWAGRG